MKILFCNTSYMKYYHGVCDLDIPQYGGSFVDKNGYGHEEFNFMPARFSDGNEYCLGFVETKSIRDNINQLHIERIGGCGALKDGESVDDVLVVWCATMRNSEKRVMGWYKGATVYRRYQECEFDNGYVQNYNIIAPAENCTLLPYTDRGDRKWNVPLARNKDYGYGFGQAMVWYADNDDEKARNYINELVKKIDEYDGKNQMDDIPLEIQ